MLVETFLAWNHQGSEAWRLGELSLADVKGTMRLGDVKDGEVRTFEDLETKRGT